MSRPRLLAVRVAACFLAILFWLPSLTVDDLVIRKLAHGALRAYEGETSTTLRASASMTAAEFDTQPESIALT